MTGMLHGFIPSPALTFTDHTTLNIKEIKMLWRYKSIFGTFFNYYISIVWVVGTAFVKAGLVGRLEDIRQTPLPQEG
ncbi:MAG: hypothetical protein IBX56_18930 [Methylomicrobium sp.]|nr:hypothetical protein [Methylomicrobium sp.]